MRRLRAWRSRLRCSISLMTPIATRDRGSAIAAAQAWFDGGGLKAHVERRIAWRTMSNGFASGVVSFEPRSEQETEVILKIRSIFDSSNLSRRVEEYLGNFKRLVERAEGRA